MESEVNMTEFYAPYISAEKTAEHLRRLRRERGLSVKQVAGLILCGTQSVYDWEAGKCLPEISRLLGISRVYGISINDILVCEGEDIAFYAA